jgi:hypothetical protein
LWDGGPRYGAYITFPIGEATLATPCGCITAVDFIGISLVQPSRLFVTRQGLTTFHISLELFFSHGFQEIASLKFTATLVASRYVLLFVTALSGTSCLSSVGTLGIKIHIFSQPVKFRNGRKVSLIPL